MDILYKDDDLLAVNKPSGLSTLPEGWDPSLSHVRSLLEEEFGPLWIVHRLDKETSGILLLARSAKAHQLLNDQFANRKTKKVYSCIVFGKLPSNADCALPLRINGDRRHRTVVDHEAGKPARTKFELVESCGDSCTYIHAFPESGYTHQIRIHSLSIGFPILGDPLYFNQDSKIFSLEHAVSRTMLHASQITFEHPGLNKQMTVAAPLPDDFLLQITQLKDKGAS